jgi:hypothetical protein
MGDRERSRRRLGGSRYDGTSDGSPMFSPTGHRQRNHPGHLSFDGAFNRSITLGTDGSMTIGSDGFVDVPQE